MAAMEWSEKLVLGLAPMDQTHVEFVDAYNRLLNVSGAELLAEMSRDDRDDLLEWIMDAAILVDDRAEIGLGVTEAIDTMIEVINARRDEAAEIAATDATDMGGI